MPSDWHIDVNSEDYVWWRCHLYIALLEAHSCAYTGAANEQMNKDFHQALFYVIGQQLTDCNSVRISEPSRVIHSVQSDIYSDRVSITGGSFASNAARKWELKFVCVFHVLVSFVNYLRLQLQRAAHPQLHATCHMALQHKWHTSNVANAT